MAKVDFRRVSTNAEVDNIEVKDGQFIVTGEGESYVDFGNERTPITSTYQIYSTTEKVIGKWTDDKPLYRKVLTDSTTSSGDHSISLSDLNFDYITIKNFNIKSGNFILNTYSDDSSTRTYCYISTAPVNYPSLIWHTGSSWANATFIGIIEYTKTTD